MSEELDINLQPANFSKRFLASTLDIVLGLFGGLLSAGIINIIFTHNALSFTILFIILFPICYFLNTILYQIKSGRTFGKFLIGLKVCYPNNKIDVRNEDIVKREFSKMVTFVTAGYSFFSKYKEEQIIAFHDDYSQTVVLNLTEDHEKYLYEHYYEDYYHTEEDEEEYNKLRQEQKEKEKENKEYTKQLKNEQKEQEKQNKKKDNQPSQDINTLPISQVATIVPLNNSESSFNVDHNSNIGGFDNNSQFNIMDTSQSHIETPNLIPNNSYMTSENSEGNNTQSLLENIQEPYTQVNSHTASHSPGVNIVGNYDFLDNNQQEQKTGLSKLKNIFKNNNKPKTNTEVHYVSNKLSNLAQDNTFLPSENIFSEQFKGWSLSDLHTDKINKVIEK